MRAATLLRWGITCLLLAPLTFVAWFASPRSADSMPSDAPEAIVAFAVGWGAVAPALGLALIVIGGTLNLLALRRGVRGLNRLMTGDAARSGGAANVEVPPQQRVIIPDDWDLEHPAGGGRASRGPGGFRLTGVAVPRRTLGGVLAGSLVVLTAMGVWIMTVEYPIAMSDDLTLDQVHAAIGVTTTVINDGTVVVWAILGGAAAAGIAILGLLRRTALDAVLSTRRFVALAAIVGSALVVASTIVLFGIGISIADAVPPYRGGSSVGSWAFGQLGIALSAAAIVLTVPRWGRAPAPFTAPVVSPYF